VLAITGLSVDVGWWYTVQRQNQSAADAAAISAAYEVLGNPTWTAAQLTPFASAAATLNGYSGTTPTVTYPFTDTIVTNKSDKGVQVVLKQAQSSWFAALAGLSGVTIADRAVAKVTVLDSPCTYILNPNAPKALDIQGSATLSSPGCSICVASNASNAVYMQGATNAVLTADTIMTAGEIATTGQPQFNLKYPAQVGMPPSQCSDPYAGTLTHSFLTSGMPTSPACTTNSSLSTNNVAIPSGSGCSVPGNCPNKSTNCAQAPNGGTVNMPGNTEITGGWSIQNETVNLAPGTYWITDGDLALGSLATLECTACVPGGAGVTIILTTAKANGGTVGNVTEQSNPTIDSLNAPGSGTFQNLLLIQDSNQLPSGTKIAPGGSTFQGTPGATLNGLVYFPDSALNFQGNPATGNSSCLLTVANTLTLKGNPTVLATTGCPTTGPGAKKTVFTVALVE
jgi:hypothetical protein